VDVAQIGVGVVQTGVGAVRIDVDEAPTDATGSMVVVTMMDEEIVAETAMTVEETTVQGEVVVEVHPGEAEMTKMQKGKHLDRVHWALHHLTTDQVLPRRCNLHSRRQRRKRPRKSAWNL
jgi:hypothetical protein